MGPCTASSCCCQARNLSWAPVPPPSCCCQVQSLSWAPVPPPHAAARPSCHGPLYHLLMLLPGPHCCVMVHYGLPLGCARPVICHGPRLPPPHAAARPVICHGPLYRLLMLLPGPESVSWVPVRPPIAAVSIATLCHVPLSGLLTHCWCVPFFVIGC
ncbi:unnamed protein product, partial [Staurois parvus]